MPAYFVTNFARQFLDADPETLSNLAWVIVATRVLLPLGFLIALLQADRFAGAALRSMLDRLATRPTPQRWRDTVAEALDDPPLQLAYRDPGTGSYREPHGSELMPPRTGTGRAWVPIDRDDQPVAAMVIDEALAEDPELVRAASTATLLAVENGALEGEVRRQIQRDIHDSAQQRLLALRIRLTLAGEALGSSEDRAMLERIDAEVEQAIEELREITQGETPAVLIQDGVAVALAQVAARAPLPIAIHADGFGRQREPVETAIYFCCLEGVQNAAKHAGSGASVAIRLGERDGDVTFTVSDDGAGFDPTAVQRGAGLTNIAHRVAAAGGTLELEARPGAGTRITGTLPT
jgi:signal transduction histidine kinase